MPVCIAGMHRSGTSMVTKILHTAGLYLGPESDLIPSNPNNPEGFWENRRFLTINADMLRKLHGSWDCPPPAPIDWSDARFAPYRSRATALLAKFAGQEPWGWKDPRNSLTLPFWQSVVDPLQVVIVVRNPLEVALSLRKRNGFSHALSLSLWYAYNQRLWEAAAASERIVSHYDAYFRNPEAELRRLLEFLDQPVGADVLDKFHEAHVADLRHHEVSAHDLAMADVAPEIIDLYSTLCTEANWRDAGLGLANGGSLDSELTSLLDDSEPTERTERPDHRSAKNGRPNRLKRLEDAEERIAELEQLVETQRIELAQYEAEKQRSLLQR